MDILDHYEPIAPYVEKERETITIDYFYHGVSTERIVKDLQDFSDGFRMGFNEGFETAFEINCPTLKLSIEPPMRKSLINPKYL